jgi:hypothetical protein
LGVEAIGRLVTKQAMENPEFLYESGLIFSEQPVLDLRGAHLSKAKLSVADLKGPT